MNVQTRFSDKLEWVEHHGRLVLRKAAIDPKTKTVTIFKNAIRANFPNDYEARLAGTIAAARARALGDGNWDEDEHPRDEDGKFTVSGGGSSSTDDGASIDAPAATSEPVSSKPKGKVKVKPEDFAKDKIRVNTPAVTMEKFIKTWDEKIGTTPADFANDFLGGTKSGNVTITPSGDTWTINGNLYSNDGAEIGNFTRELRFDRNSAYSAYFSLNRNARGSDVGKQVLAGNVETYRKLGFKSVAVSANIDVGGYAWAKYGYVPTQSSWDSIRHEIQAKLGRNGGRRGSSSTSTYTPESWDEISDYDQTMIRDRWKNDSYSEFYDNEVQSWRENGEALAQAKKDLANNFVSAPEWAVDAIKEIRESRAENGDPPIPYTDDQLFSAISVDYDEDDYEGRKDPDISFDDAYLKNPQGYDESQGTLPGIEPLDPASFLNDEMREQLSDGLTKAFNDQAESDKSDIEPPDWLRDRAHEYAEEYWDQIDDDEKFRIAERGGYLPEIEIENDDEDEQLELVDVPEDENALLTKLAQSSDPKSMWAIADSPKGKELLLGTSWSGVLKFDDSEAMARFNAYVGKSSKKKPAMAEAA